MKKKIEKKIHKKNPPGTVDSLPTIEEIMEKYDIKPEEIPEIFTPGSPTGDWSNKGGQSLRGEDKTKDPNYIPPENLNPKYTERLANLEPDIVLESDWRRPINADFYNKEFEYDEETDTTYINPLHPNYVPGRTDISTVDYSRGMLPDRNFWNIDDLEPEGIKGAPDIEVERWYPKHHPRAKFNGMKKKFEEMNEEYFPKPGKPGWTQLNEDPLEKMKKAGELEEKLFEMGFHDGTNRIFQKTKIDFF